MKMKILLSIAVLFFLSAACTSGSRMARVDKPAAPNLVNPAEGEDEYRLIIMDPGFQSWFTTYGRPINFYTQAYYEQWNTRYVNQWNELAMRSGSFRNANHPFQNRIDYDPNINYGIQLNHELYWYFRYVEATVGNHYNFGFGNRHL